MTSIYVDADACPVKNEIYRVAARYGLKVHVVSNSYMNVPRDPGIELVVVSDSFDAADNWIAERAGPGDIVITSDIPLAARCLARAAWVLGPKGVPFTEGDIGSALAMRDLLADLRQGGQAPAGLGGPAPMTAKDRSRFLGKLDELVTAVRRAHPAGTEAQA